MEKLHENHFSTADDTGLYLDVDGYENIRKKMLASVEALVLDTSQAFAMEDEVNGTESVQLLIDQWHKVAETTENFRQFYIDYVDPALVRVKDSIINEDEEISAQLNTEEQVDISGAVNRGLDNIRNKIKAASMVLEDLFDSDIDENIRGILKKDAYLWSQEDAYLVSKRYSKAVKAHNVEALNDFYNSLLVVNNSDMYDIDEHGRKVYYSSAHLDKEKAFVILANLEAMDGVNTEAYQTLLELTAGEFSYAEKSKLKLTSKINISKNEQGFVIDWKTSMDGKQRDSHQTMLFFDDGLSLRKKYRLIDDIDGVNTYKLALKSTIVSKEISEYQSVESNSDFKKLSKYIEEEREFKWITIETPTNYKESDVYRYINDETSRLEYIRGNRNFVCDHYEAMSDEQKSVYNYLYQKDKVNHTNKAEKYRRSLTPLLRDQFADNTVNNSNNFEKGLLGQMVVLDRIATGLKHWSGIGNQANIDSFGEQIPTDIAMMDPKIDSSLTGGWHTFYDVNKIVGASIPGVAIGALTGGSGTVAEIVGAGSVATIYGGSAYGNAIGYAEQSGYSDSQAKAFATKTGINEGCKTLLFYGLLKGTGAASSAGYMSAGESAAVSAAGGFGIEFLDETSVKPNIQESTLGEDVDVDYKRALENAAVAGLITGAASYVYTKSNTKPAENQNIFDNAYILDDYTDVRKLTAKWVKSVVAKNGMTVDDFSKLLNPNKILTQDEKVIVDKVREEIGLPSTGTIMNKTIPQSDIYNYLYNEDYSGVRGFVSVDEYSKNLKTLGDVFEGNRLDYNNTAFKVGRGVDGVSRLIGEEDTVYGKITYILDDNNTIGFPNAVPNEENIPYTGRGFTGSKRVILPELLQQKRAFAEGDILSIYDAKTGNQLVQFIYDLELGWILK